MAPEESPRRNPEDEAQIEPTFVKREKDATVSSMPSESSTGLPRKISRRRRRKGRNREVWAKVWIGLIFLLLRGNDAIAYIRASPEEKGTLLVPFLAAFIATTLLLIAIWGGIDLARYGLIALLLYFVSSSLIYGPSLIGKIPTESLLLLGAETALNLAMILLLAFSSDIRAITEPAPDVPRMTRHS